MSLTQKNGKWPAKQTDKEWPNMDEKSKENVVSVTPSELIISGRWGQ